MDYGVAMRTRSYRHLSAEERETLSLCLAAANSLRRMAMVLGRAPSTVSREISRNAGWRRYQACTGHTLASARAQQPQRLRKLRDPWLWSYVHALSGRATRPSR